MGRCAVLLCIAQPRRAAYRMLDTSPYSRTLFTYSMVCAVSRSPSKDWKCQGQALIPSYKVIFAPGTHSPPPYVMTSQSSPACYPSPSSRHRSLTAQYSNLSPGPLL
ncbi:hypothetical protein F5Y07DRAFT_371190 [Xylaria sp. FL0933]|nr:hypothetical protein F5Y07DRAFT_371190 [Xylaria sp. FL0933]